MATIPDKRQADGTETREKIDGYLTRSGLASRSPRVVPLTGDASDRRYFRVLLPASGSIVLSLHLAPQYLPYGIAFDIEKLTWELDFFIKHFIEAYRGVVIAGPVKDELRRE